MSQHNVLLGKRNDNRGLYVILFHTYHKIIMYSKFDAIQGKWESVRFSDTT